MKGLFLFVIFLIAYGSLFPFEFRYIEWETQGRNILLATSFFGGRMGDNLNNIGLFIPLGLVGSEFIFRNNKGKKYYLYLYGLGFLLALTLQILQIYLPSRVPALYDAIWNLFGIFTGVVIAKFIRNRFPALIKSNDKYFLLVLLSCWVLSLLTPFFFLFNLSILNENMLTHLNYQSFNIANLFLYIGIWLSFSLLINALLPNSFKYNFYLEAIVILTSTLKMFTYRNIIEPEIAIGGLCAIIIVRSKIFKLVNPYKLTAFILMFSMLYYSLSPFEFDNNPFKEISWLPFAEYFRDDILPSIRMFFFKTFIYGSILWTLYKSYPNAKYITLFCFIFAAFIEIVQFFIIFRVSGVSEPLLVLILSTFLKQKKEAYTPYKNEEEMGKSYY
jgi:VanZ family protein